MKRRPGAPPIVRLAHILCFAALLSAARPLHAAAINKQIMIAGLNVGTLDLANPVRVNDGTILGAAVSGQFAGIYPPLKSGVEARWVQLISTNDPRNTNAGANVPYFDPGELDIKGDNEPFYWNTPLKAKDDMDHPELWYKTYQIDSGKGIKFSDEPARELRDRPINWTAELNLVCTMTGAKEFDVLWSGNYGFNIDNDGNLTVNGYSELANPVYLTQARLTQYFDGWTLGNPVNCIPEPMAICLLMILACRGLQRRHFCAHYDFRASRPSFGL